jgi:hypothetical protein
VEPQQKETEKPEQKGRKEKPLWAAAPQKNGKIERKPS